MISVYSNSFITDCRVKDLKFNTPYIVHPLIDHYAVSSGTKKIAFINSINNYDSKIVAQRQSLLTTTNNEEWLIDEINQVKDISDLVIVFHNEMHQYHVDTIFPMFNQPNIIWAIPGTVNDDRIINRKQIILFNQHIELFMGMYRPFGKLHEKLKELNPYSGKPKFFDALLGRARPHRDFVYDQIFLQNLQSKFLVSYVKDDYNQFENTFLWEPGIKKITAQVSDSTQLVQYSGCNVALSRILPIDIFNQTAYSIVAETGWDNRYSFFTEKTAKPMLAKRLFVMFSGAGFLKNLKALGFRTFDNVIDESYDSVVSDYDRWSLALEQVKRLCNMDQIEVFKQIKPAVEHNYELLMETDWEKYLLEQLKTQIFTNLLNGNQTDI